MAKLRRGALRNWVFDQPDEESTYHLFVYLRLVPRPGSPASAGRIEFAEPRPARATSSHRSKNDSYLTRLRTSAAQDRERSDAQNVRTIMRGTFA
ncbi:hypothetical protein [Nocardia jiangsuensis]|uniref:Uncharacterized protein n=1 Tax=Nocardia jiangsuensis TaxID=1691563 RepID=A0ABV8DVN2_9NOCA